jgi:hypothetical protein
MPANKALIGYFYAIGQDLKGIIAFFWVIWGVEFDCLGSFFGVFGWIWRNRFSKIYLFSPFFRFFTLFSKK